MVYKIYSFRFINSIFIYISFDNVVFCLFEMHFYISSAMLMMIYIRSLHILVAIYSYKLSPFRFGLSNTLRFKMRIFE